MVHSARYVVSLACSNQETGSSILDQLKTSNGRLADSKIKCITVIQHVQKIMVQKYTRSIKFSLWQIHCSFTSVMLLFWGRKTCYMFWGPEIFRLVMKQGQIVANDQLVNANYMLQSVHGRQWTTWWSSGSLRTQWVPWKSSIIKSSRLNFTTCHKKCRGYTSYNKW